MGRRPGIRVGFMLWCVGVCGTLGVVERFFRERTTSEIRQEMRQVAVGRSRVVLAVVCQRNPLPDSPFSCSLRLPWERVAGAKKNLSALWATCIALV